MSIFNFSLRSCLRAIRSRPLRALGEGRDELDDPQDPPLDTLLLTQGLLQKEMEKPLACCALNQRHTSTDTSSLRATRAFRHRNAVLIATRVVISHVPLLCLALQHPPATVGVWLPLLCVLWQITPAAGCDCSHSRALCRRR